MEYTGPGLGQGHITGIHPSLTWQGSSLYATREDLVDGDGGSRGSREVDLHLDLTSCLFSCNYN